MNCSLTKNWLIGVGLLVFACAGTLALPGHANAKQELIPIVGINYNVNASMANNLRVLKGRGVSVTLDSGKTMTGMVSDVGDKLLHLENLEGKEFYDALIRIDSINSIDTRFRAYSR